MGGMALDLNVDTVQLTEDLVNIESVSGNEQQIADAVEEALSGLAHLEVQRFGNTIVARTNLGRDERVVIAGHIDTVPLNDNLPARRDPGEGGNLHGLGTCDMKSGCAVALRIAATMPEPNRDITFCFYECEEVEAERNGLFLLSQSNPELLEADFAILMEPSDAVGGAVNPKFGWTDVARFTVLGVPAVNYGPGDPSYAHKQDEHVPIEQIRRCEQTLRSWLGAS